MISTRCIVHVTDGSTIRVSWDEYPGALYYTLYVSLNPAAADQPVSWSAVYNTSNVFTRVYMLTNVTTGLDYFVRLAVCIVILFLFVSVMLSNIITLFIAFDAFDTF